MKIKVPYFVAAIFMIQSVVLSVLLFRQHQQHEADESQLKTRIEQLEKELTDFKQDAAK